MVTTRTRESPIHIGFDGQNVLGAAGVDRDEGFVVIAEVVADGVWSPGVSMLKIVLTAQLHNLFDGVAVLLEVLQAVEFVLVVAMCDRAPAARLADLGRRGADCGDFTIHSALRWQELFIDCALDIALCTVPDSRHGPFLNLLSDSPRWVL